MKMNPGLTGSCFMSPEDCSQGRIQARRQACMHAHTHTLLLINGSSRKCRAGASKLSLVGLRDAMVASQMPQELKGSLACIKMAKGRCEKPAKHSEEAKTSVGKCRLSNEDVR